MKVTVIDNDVTKAMKILKRKMQKEGVFRDMEKHEHFVQPSVAKRLRKKAAVKKQQKAQAERNKAL